MVSPWTAWNAGQPAGTKLLIDVEQLQDVDDERVRLIAALLEHAMEVLVELRCGDREAQDGPRPSRMENVSTAHPSTKPLPLQDRRTRSAFRGYLPEDAVGDALGASVEFMKRAEIRRRFGPNGIMTFVKPADEREYQRER